MSKHHNILSPRFKKAMAHTAGVTLLLLGLVVLLAWHLNLAQPALRNQIVVMGYNTAICFLLSGISLIALVRHHRGAAHIAGTAVMLISGLSLLSLYIPTAMDTWYLTFIAQPPSELGHMSPMTAGCFLLSSSSLLLHSYCRESDNSFTFIVGVLLNFIVSTIALIALFGFSIDLIPAFVWLGIKMAPHTALGFLILAISQALYSLDKALTTFNHLTFFKRIITAIVFMSLLFVVAGTIALLQIQSIAQLTRELYQRPLNITNSMLLIKDEVIHLNRVIKNIAIAPDLRQDYLLLELLKNTQGNIVKEQNKILLQAPDFEPDLNQFTQALNQWASAVRLATEELSQEDISAYRNNALNNSQQQAIILEQMTDNLIIKAQQQLSQLDTRIAAAEADAQQLIIICLIAFLTLGLLVSLFIARSFNVQLQNLRLTMIDISKDKAKTEIPYLNHRNEIGEIANTLAVFARNVLMRQQMETRMSQIIEAAPNGIIVVNADGLIEIANKQTEIIFGYNRSELIGQPIEILLPTAAAQQNPHNRQTFFAAPSTRTMGAGRELHGKNKAGREIPVEIGLAPLSTEDGLWVLASIVDISERIQTTQALAQHQRNLEITNKNLSQSNSDLEAFAYVASHDLKSPLRGIAQLSAWIDEDIGDKNFSDLPRHTKMLRSRIKRMDKLLDDLLLYYRAGTSEANEVMIDVEKMVHELFESHNTKPGMRLVLQPPLPVFPGFSAPFEQVMRNLISNAIKHHDRDKGCLQLRAEDYNSGYYKFVLSDDGPGIPQEFHQRVFGMFQTLRPRDEVEGSGIGLPLIQKIVTRFGGSIQVQSDGRGTEFHFTWPKGSQRVNL